MTDAPALSDQFMRANAATLHYIAANPGKHETAQTLAVSLGRSTDNIRKTVKILRDADVLERESAIRLTAAGADLVKTLPEPEPANAVRVAADAMPAGFAMIDHQLIVPDALNPREDFSEDEDADFIADIEANGILQNLLVRPPAPMEGYGQDMHRLVAGERRWRAVKALIARGAWRADRLVPCQVRDVDDERHSRLAMIENLQRKGLKPLEEARGFKRMMDDYGYSTDDIAAAISFTVRYVQQRLQLLSLDEDTQSALDEGRITVERARQIAGEPKPVVFKPSADDLFVMAEILHKLEAEGKQRGWRGTGVEIKHVKIGKSYENKVSDPTLQRLITNQIVNIWIDEGKSERTFIGRSHRWPVKVELPEIPKGTAIYQTTWLNGPFPLPKAAADAVAARRVELAETKVKNKAARTAAASLAERVEKFIALPLPLWPDDAARFQALMKEAGSGYPWTVTDHAINEAAPGRQYDRGAFNFYGADPSARRLLAFAVNAAGADQTEKRPQTTVCNHIVGLSVAELAIVNALFECAEDAKTAISQMAGVTREEFETLRDRLTTNPITVGTHAPPEVAFTPDDGDDGLHDVAAEAAE